MNVNLAGTGVYLSQKKISNLDLYDIINQEDKNVFNIEKAKISIEKKGNSTDSLTHAEIFDKWVQQVCGIRFRTYFNDKTLENLPDPNTVVEYQAKCASIQALESANIAPEEIEHIVFSSYSSDYLIPSPASALSEMIGANNASGVSINGACSGFLDALLDACAKIEARIYNKVLVVASEYLSNKMDYTDVTTCILFSDGAGAFLLKRSDENNPPNFSHFSSKFKYNQEQINMYRTSNIHMGGGPYVQKNAVNSMAGRVHDILEKENLSIDDIDYIVPHQANIRILDALENKLKLSEKTTMIKCIQETGNLSSATIPVAFNQLYKKQTPELNWKHGDHVILTAVGGGYTFGAVSMTL